MLKEIKRILKPNGLLFIREHDRTDKHIDKLIRLEHLLYSQLVDKIDYKIYLESNYEKYFSRKRLEYRLQKMGFSILTQKYEIKRKYDNPTNYFNILVQLNKN